jgi:GTPase
MEELERLLHTYGGTTVVKEIQKRDAPDPNTYVGSGKIAEILAYAESLQADVIILGNILKPGQIYQIERAIQQQKLFVQVWDRIDLILKIFARHATTPEARLQIELASIDHMGPRIYGMGGAELSRQASGSGAGGGGGASRGLGETNTERMKRHLKERKQAIKKELTHYQSMREQHRKHRTRQGFSTIGVVGYTNAGKSSLMQALTSKDTYIADALFATLATHTGMAHLGTHPTTYAPIQALVSDTIGFIQDLPPSLIDAFRSTLEDSIESHLLLHVVDATDPDIAMKMKVVQDILASI